MVPSRCVKSEYMKRFQEPKWEACGPCYQELLRYRLSRRLLEQAHRPWFWDGWEPDSGGGGGGGGSSSSRGSSSSNGSAPSPIAAPPLREEEEPEEWGAAPELPLRGEPEEEEQEKTEADKKSAAKRVDKPKGQQQEPPASRSAVGARGDRRQAKSPQRTETTKELRHPFALYGWGEKQTDTGNQKTHNVCASASQNEIHESALRAKNRRQVEKRKMPQRQVRSADVEKTWRMKSSGADNPWMTEYMRCYSARTR